MPVPADIELKEGRFRVSEDFKIGISGQFDDRLYKYADRILRRLARRTGLFFIQNYLTANKNPGSPDLRINVERKGEVKLNEDESYILEVTSQGIELSATTDLGALRGLETFLQLLDVDESGYYFPSVSIKDTPRFPWRGLLIDVGRHFMPVKVIKRNLLGMAAVKMNVLHWHLTEDQGFRVESKVYPKLHLMGSDGFYYTQEQIRDVVRFADDLGIRVMPEFDMPGHANSWLVGYPELSSDPGPYEVIRRWGVFDPVLDPTKDSTYRFLDKFFKEMADLFPDEYMHIGGDENNGKQWNSSPEIQSFMKDNNIKDNHELQAYFNKRILTSLTKYKKKMVGWDEIFQPYLPNSIVIQSWRGKKTLEESAQKGFQAILSNGYYIDLIRPTHYHYLNDPIPESSTLTDDQKKYILGGEATMWAEYISNETIDSRVWPRTAAIAERFWSKGSVTDISDMYRRLEITGLRLEELGLLHEKNYDMFLRRLAGGRDTQALRNFIDVIEPLKGYKRGSRKRHFQHSPLSRVVDTARPDQYKVRRFILLVDQYIETTRGHSGIYDVLQSDLILWQKNHAELLGIIRKSPILKEIETLSEDLSKAASIGFEALQYIQNGWQKDAKWVKESLGFLTKAKEPRGQTEIMILPGIEKLVNAAGGK